MTYSLPDQSELLSRHAAWVQALARRLVDDPGGADDLAQETMLAALERPRGDVRSRRAWLGGILRNLARVQRRGDARRRTRETAAARSGTAPSVDETLSRAEVGRELAGQVLALDEPYRTVVLLRFYENLPPRAIAERIGAPVRTVDSRLARGLAKLREKWGSSDDARPGALAVLAYPAGPVGPVGKTLAASASLPLGALAMNTKLVAVAAAALGVGVLVVLTGLDETPEPAEVVGPGANGGTIADAALDGNRGVEPRTNAEAVARAREAVANQDTRPTDTVEPTVAVTRVVRGRVLDVEARALDGIEVRFRPDRRPGDTIHATSAADGTFDLVAPLLDGRVAVVSETLTTVIAGVARVGSDIPTLVVVAETRAVSGTVVDEFEGSLEDAHVRITMPEGFDERFEAVLDATDGGSWGAITDEEGRFELAHVPIVDGARLEATLDGYEADEIELDGLADLEIVVRMQRRDDAARYLEGLVVDRDGRAVRGARVTLGERSAVTDTVGEFRLDMTFADDSFELTAVLRGFLPGYVRAEKDPVTERPVWPSSVVVELGDPALAIAGIVVDQEGEPRPGVMVWLADPTPFGLVDEDIIAQVEYLLGGDEESEPNWKAVFSDAEGRFRVEGVLDRPYTLQLFDERTLASGPAGPFDAGSDDVKAVLDSGPKADLAGRIVSSAGQPIEGVRVQLLAPAFGGIWIKHAAGTLVTDEEGRFAFESVSGSGHMLSIRGDDVVPSWNRVVVDHRTTEVEMVVAIRCHVKLDLVGSAAERANRFEVLDGEDQPMALYRVSATGVTTTHGSEIHEGRSTTFGVADTARTVVVYDGDEELRRIPLSLVPGELNVVN